MIDDTIRWDDFDTAAAVVAAAGEAADVFGPPEAGAAPTAQAKATYRRYAWACHPDHAGPDRIEVAEATFVKLNRLWRQWQGDAAGAAPGGGFNLTTQKHRWTAERRWGSDEVCDLFEARDTAGAAGAAERAWLKIPRRPEDSDLVAAESRALARLAADADPRWAPYFPRLLALLRHRDAAGSERRIAVVEALDGFCSLADVMAAYPGGVDPRDAAWMWRRLLVGLGASHRAGVVHAGLFPHQVFIHPDQHGLVLAGWYYAVDEPGRSVPAVVEAYRSWYPPEVLGRRPAGPATDIALSARLMATVVGSRLPGPLDAFVAGCTLPDPATRPDDAWKLLAEFDELIGRLWGRRRYRPFSIPVTNT